MTLDKLFSDDLFEEYSMQEKYKVCRGLIEIFNTKTKQDIKNEVSEVWKTWKNGKEKTNFCVLCGIDKQRMHNLLTSGNTISFEEYAKIMAVGKNYTVIVSKYGNKEVENER